MSDKSVKEHIPKDDTASETDHKVLDKLDLAERQKNYEINTLYRRRNRELLDAALQACLKKDISESERKTEMEMIFKEMTGLIAAETKLQVEGEELKRLLKLASDSKGKDEEPHSQYPHSYIGEGSTDDTDSEGEGKMTPSESTTSSRASSPGASTGH